MHVHGGHIEAAGALGDADDAHGGPIGGVQDDGDLVDGGASELVPQDFGDDDGGQTLLGVAGRDPPASEHAGAEDDLVGGVDGLDGDVVKHVVGAHDRVAAELTAAPRLADLGDFAAAAGQTRPVADVVTVGQRRHGLADGVGVVGARHARRGRGTPGARGLGWPGPGGCPLARGGVFGGEAQRDGAPLVELGHFAGGLKDQVAQGDDDRHGGHGGDDADEGEDDAGLLHLDLAPRLDEGAQDLADGVHWSPSSRGVGGAGTGALSGSSWAGGAGGSVTTGSPPTCSATAS